jgi:transposase
MVPYSNDLRERVLMAVDAGEGTQEEIAMRFRVSGRWIRKLLARRIATGSIAPKPNGGGRKLSIQGESAEALRAAVRDDPDATLAELREATGFKGCVMTVWRAIERLNITRKKKSLRAREQLDPEVIAQRREWGERTAGIDPDRFVFLDESNAKTTMTRAYGRAPRGERVVDHVPAGKSHWTTMMGAVRRDGTVAAMVYQGGTDVAAMEAFAEGDLRRIVRPGDIVVMDNLTCHKTAEVARLIAAAGAEVRHLPAYSPDLNPIEKVFSKLKEYLRSAAVRTIEGLIAAMGDALRTVRPGDILGWFRHSGYEAPPASDPLNKKLL